MENNFDIRVFYQEEEGNTEFIVGFVPHRLSEFSNYSEWGILEYASYFKADDNLGKKLYPLINSHIIKSPYQYDYVRMAILTSSSLNKIITTLENLPADFFKKLLTFCAYEYCAENGDTLLFQAMLKNKRCLAKLKSIDIDRMLKSHNGIFFQLSEQKKFFFIAALKTPLQTIFTPSQLMILKEIPELRKIIENDPYLINKINEHIKELKPNFSDKNASEDLFNTMLPKDVILKIFKELKPYNTNIEMVNKRWNIISQDEGLWRQLYLDITSFVGPLPHLNDKSYVSQRLENSAEEKDPKLNYSYQDKVKYLWLYIKKLIVTDLPKNINDKNYIFQSLEDFAKGKGPKPNYSYKDITKYLLLCIKKMASTDLQKNTDDYVNNIFDARCELSRLSNLPITEENRDQKISEQRNIMKLNSAIIKFIILTPSLIKTAASGISIGEFLENIFSKYHEISLYLAIFENKKLCSKLGLVNTIDLYFYYFLDSMRIDLTFWNQIINLIMANEKFEKQLHHLIDFVASKSAGKPPQSHAVQFREELYKHPKISALLENYTIDEWLNLLEKNSKISPNPTIFHVQRLLQTPNKNKFTPEDLRRLGKYYEVRLSIAADPVLFRKMIKRQYEVSWPSLAADPVLLTKLIEEKMAVRQGKDNTDGSQFRP